MELARSEVAARVPPRLSRLLDQLHGGLVGRPVALPDVAGQPRAEDVLPRGRAAARERDHVVERELRGRESMAAILAAAPVAQVDVVARKLPVLPRKAVELLERDDARHADPRRRRKDHLVLWLNGDVAPVLELPGAVVRKHGADVPLVEEGEGFSDGRDLDRLKNAIQDQHLRVEQMGLPGARHYNPSTLRTLRIRGVSPR